jgi:RNA polymerase sigma-70 factor (ECF subfamily)
MDRILPKMAISTSSTSLSLLDRLRRTRDPETWARFVEIYGQLIVEWNQEAGLQSADANDVAQEILLAVLEKIPGFQRTEEGSFRMWLRTIALAKIRGHNRRRKRLDRMEDIDSLPQMADPGPEREYAADYSQSVVSRALKVISRDFEESTWRAFELVFFEGRDPEVVGRELGMSRNSVYIARSRVSKKVREILRDLIDEDLF